MDVQKFEDVPFKNNCNRCAHISLRQRKQQHKGPLKNPKRSLRKNHSSENFN